MTTNVVKENLKKRYHNAVDTIYDSITSLIGIKLSRILEDFLNSIASEELNKIVETLGYWHEGDYCDRLKNYISDNELKYKVEEKWDNYDDFGKLMNALNEIIELSSKEGELFEQGNNPK